MLVEGQLVVEIKAVEAIHEVHAAQLLTYLKLGNWRVGLLINFQCSGTYCRDSSHRQSSA